MVLLSVFSGALVLGMAIKEETQHIEMHLIDENKRLAQIAAQSIEAGYITQTWPFRTLKQVNESEDVLFWWIVNPDGEIYLADDADMWGMIINDVSLDVNETVVEDYIYFRTDEGIKLIIQPLDIGVPEETWALCLGISLKSVNEATTTIVLTGLGYFSVIIIIAIILSFYLARGFTGPIKQLVEATEIISKGGLDHRVQIKTQDELGTLALS
ncbi:MAG: HAMP domain-containing protein, partial [Syntrophales bacterium]|nr:HAMP domain-containing protein [Syntrophales bacterium]